MHQTRYHEICKLYKIDISKLARRELIDKATIYDASIQKQEDFIADKSKHLASERYSDHKYGFMIKDALKFEEPIYMKGRLGFFNVDIR